jgi:hypothetical protein
MGTQLMTLNETTSSILEVKRISKIHCNFPMPNYSTTRKKGKIPFEGTIGIFVKRSHQIGFEQTGLLRSIELFCPCLVIFKPSIQFIFSNFGSNAKQ